MFHLRKQNSKYNILFLIKITFFLANQTFFLYQCFECQQKTSYCQFCSKIIGKLFNDLFFKCARCNIISRTVTKELVTADPNPNLFPPSLNISSSEYKKVFGNSIMNNESCINNLFGKNNFIE